MNPVIYWCQHDPDFLISISTYDYGNTFLSFSPQVQQSHVQTVSNCPYSSHTLIWIVGSLIDNDKENMIDSPDTAIMTRQWKKKLQKQISVFRQIMLDIGE